jgi:hypothetical protein
MISQKINIIINSTILVIIITSVLFVFIPLFIKIPKNFHTDSIDKSELKIYKDKTMYNLGDILLITHCNYPPDHLYRQYTEHPQYHNAVNDYPDSILAIYDGLRISPQEEIPNIENLQKAIDIYIERNKTNKDFTDLIDFVNNKDVLCVHLRSGDYGEIEDDFKNIILQLKKYFKYLVVMCGIHNNNSSECLIESIKKIFYDTDKQNIFISIEDPDMHLSMFRSCQNLLLHKNGFSILAGFVFNGDKLFLSKKILYSLWNYELPEGNGKWTKHLQPENNQINQIIYL